MPSSTEITRVTIKHRVENAISDEKKADLQEASKTRSKNNRTDDIVAWPAKSPQILAVYANGSRPMVNTKNDVAVGSVSEVKRMTRSNSPKEY